MSALDRASVKHESGELSAYELERLENMRRNEEHLESLGLDSHVPATRRKPAAPRKRPAPPVATAPAEGVRRSSRQRSSTAVYTDDTPLPQPRRVPVYALPYEGPDEPPETQGSEGGKVKVEATASLSDRPAPDPGTSRAIKLDVASIIASHLGRQIDGPSTKDSAIRAITDGRGARFSKYAGCLEWRNAILLWVNVGGSDYKNVFKPDKESGGLTVTWYASKMLNEQTPVVLRMLATAGKADGKGDGGGSKDTVLLFCRGLNDRGGYEPYVCCGRLGYVSHVPGIQPLKFVWRLLDADGLKGMPDFDDLME